MAVQNILGEVFGNVAITLGVDGLPNGLYMCILHGKDNALLARSKIAVIR